MRLTRDPVAVLCKTPLRSDRKFCELRLPGELHKIRLSYPVPTDFVSFRPVSQRLETYMSTMIFLKASKADAHLSALAFSLLRNKPNVMILSPRTPCSATTSLIWQPSRRRCVMEGLESTSAVKRRGLYTSIILSRSDIPGPVSLSGCKSRSNREF
ncbi:hypothetical protein DENSPDRAFT_447441 [Dentipellis sp. KUC8613]|nr:hypothetical protein DENSPDRAFT_447441 [Dentipellis sp. KUC8613]